MSEFLTTPELAERWHLSKGYLVNMRWAGEGPPYVKLGGRVLYRLGDILKYEEARTVLPAQGAGRE